MNKKAALAMFMGVAMSSLPRKEQPVEISSHKIEQKEEEEQLSKQKLQRMKGKKARTNRGKNRRKQ